MYESCAPRSAICCANAARSAGVVPAICIHAIVLRTPPITPIAVMAISPTVCCFSAMRKRVTGRNRSGWRLTLLSAGLRPVVVVREEDLLEARFATGEADHARTGDGGHERLERAAQQTGRAVV